MKKTRDTRRRRLNAQPAAATGSNPAPRRKRRVGGGAAFLGWVGIAGVALGVVVGMLRAPTNRLESTDVPKVASQQPAPMADESSSPTSWPAGTLTFHRHIAPIVWRRCAGCHRPGQAAPFDLITHADFRRRLEQVAEVTRRRLMPPWLPESAPGEFEGDRRLTDVELGMLLQWIAEGGVEGQEADRQPTPTLHDDWVLGAPDLVVEMDRAFVLESEGRDVYRNFVLPIPVDRPRFVRAVEFKPGNRRIVHHAFLFIDRTRQSRRRAEKESAPGFPGMDKPETAAMPEGQFLAYQPGKIPSALPDGMAWVLEPGSDLVIQVHLNPTGKPEDLRAAVGLHFTDQPPLRTPYKMLLGSLILDIPAGEAEYVVTDSFRVPVPVEVLGVLPHAHYLAREMTGDAVLPDGSVRSLLHIPRWDFNWQGDYRFARPVSLPAGAVLRMRYVYDNSSNNVLNPNHPPLRVQYGPGSGDEMAELWFQLLVRSPADRAALHRAYAPKSQQVFWDLAAHRLRSDPEDPEAHRTVGTLLMKQGKTVEALDHLRRVVARQPTNATAHLNVGLALLELGRLDEAGAEFDAAVRLDAGDHRAIGSLGTVLMRTGRLAEAVRCFERALAINPDDDIAADNLRLTREALKAAGTTVTPATPGETP